MRDELAALVGRMREINSGNLDAYQEFSNFAEDVQTMGDEV